MGCRVGWLVGWLVGREGRKNEGVCTVRIDSVALSIMPWIFSNGGVRRFRAMLGMQNIVDNEIEKPPKSAVVPRGQYR